jgi:non-heme chloroperoxidase
MRIAPEIPALLRLTAHPGFPHWMLTTHADVLNPEMLAFIQS